MQKQISPVLAGMVVLVLVSSSRAQPQLVTLSRAANPSLITPSAMAGAVTSQSSGLTIVSGTATIGINNSNHPGAATDPRAIGRFLNGNAAPGTSLQDPVDPNAVFAGGIGISVGVCLSTGFLSDNEPTRPGGFSPLVGVEGANNGRPIDVTNQGEISKVFQANDPFNDDDWAAVHTGLTGNSGDRKKIPSRENPVIPPRWLTPPPHIARIGAARDFGVR